jgi:hypothetical protein
MFLYSGGADRHYVLKEVLTGTQTNDRDSMYPYQGVLGGFVGLSSESPEAATTVKLYTYDIEPYNVPLLIDVNANAVVNKLNGNKNSLTVTVIEEYDDGEIIVYEETFSINNNAADTYQVGSYKVYVDTKGNNQIRACYIVE